MDNRYSYLAVVFHGRKWTSSCNERFSICPLVEIRRVGFVETRGVGEREDHGALDVRGHLLNDFFSEGLRAWKSCVSIWSSGEV